MDALGISFWPTENDAFICLSTEIEYMKPQKADGRDYQAVYYLTDMITWTDWQCGV